MKMMNGVQSASNLTHLQMGLKQCKDQSGFFNPMKAFEKLNDIQKQEDPNAYVPEVIIQINKKKEREEELLRVNKEIKNSKIKNA